MGGVYMRVHITQCLCPNRHCIAALAWEEPDFTPETAITKLRGTIEDAVAKEMLNHRCGICDSPYLVYEDGITKFESLLEATANVLMCQEEQMRTRMAIEAQRN
jgi:hypothetical protein